MPRYLPSFLFLFYVMFCFVLTSPPLMLCVYLQTFEAALFWKKKKKKTIITFITNTSHKVLPPTFVHINKLTQLQISILLKDTTQQRTPAVSLKECCNQSINMLLRLLMIYNYIPSCNKEIPKLQHAA